ncbi:polysaccharide deacetylase family protein [Pseudonocardia sp. WMMC193]|uniref:polysaccharide deacetylase family protein n=1 Tax=Pseudonocardia sp. WMMC193 TaxID=2911965 RepID=UPI001F2185B3|nr:polysaccharide deacetylase family protein [Pseudonocardia sp. WMMC193]MCF7547577.1 polysaccharide deacetylase family protein [Pseudonocardia sp. WMMC193]
MGSGCRDGSRRGLPRRAFVGLLGLGLAACSAPATGGGQPAGGPTPAAPAVPALPPIPAAVPGRSTTVSSGPADGSRVALTVDDGTCADCVAGYVEFARRTGTHLTFSPNGTYAREWEPHAAVLAPLVAAGQVQVMNHTFTHPKLTTLADGDVRAELARNEDWVQRVFGITTRPYYRPPYGLHDARVDGVAADAGWTRSVLWNGSYSDSTTITPEFLMSQAEKYLTPGRIVLGHANHSTVLGLFDQITDLIRQRGLTPVTLDEMFGTSRATGTA